MSSRLHSESVETDVRQRLRQQQVQLSNPSLPTHLPQRSGRTHSGKLDSCEAFIAGLRGLVHLSKLSNCPQTT